MLCLVLVILQKELTKMNQILHRSLCIATLFVTCVAVADVIPYLAPRSQGINGARELVGWQTQINKWDMCNYYGSFSITPEYTRTFWGDRITQALFGNALVNGTDSCHNGCSSSCDWHCSSSCDTSCGDTILIQGTKVTDRSSNALMAENFYLPTDYSSQITFRPRVENFLVDFNYYQGLDEWVEGMYFRIHTPVTWTRWGLHYCEDIISSGTLPMDPGYFNNTYTPSTTPLDTDVYGLARSSLLDSFSDYVSAEGSIEGVTGITYNPLEKARWSTCRKTKTALAEITAALGWNFVRRENFLFGLNIRAAAPTGNRPHGTYIFEPIVGNGKHWELGGGLNSWWTWWKSCDENRNLTVYLDAYVTHMFKTRQCRTFDLVDKPLSRYMLAMQFQSADIEYLTTGSTNISGSVAPAYQFNNIFTPIANLTTIPVDVSYAAQGEAILKFAYTHCNFQFDLGYDFWGRTCAKIKKCCNSFADNVWGLKGDAFVYGFPGNTDVNSPAIPLSATESAATIYGGTNNWPDGSSDEFWNQNPGIDNASPAYNGNTGSSLELLTHEIGDSSFWYQVNTSYQPVLLTSDDIDTCSAQTKAYSNKLFTHFNYTWKEHKCWTPYLGIGGEVEFGSRGNFCGTASNCHTSCHTSNTSCHTSNTSCHTGCHSCDNNCQKFAFSQWGVWVKGGFSFN